MDDMNELELTQGRNIPFSKVAFEFVSHSRLQRVEGPFYLVTSSAKKTGCEIIKFVP